MCDLVTIDILTRALAEWDMPLDDVQKQRFQRYADLLVEWNSTRVNLTRLTSPEQIAIQHFVDSIALFKVIQLPRGASVLDIGTGAGFPGLALKIFRPDLSITLLEAGLKKIKFCEAVRDELELEDVTAIHGRAEAFPRSGRAAGHHDLVTARGVTALRHIAAVRISVLAARNRPVRCLERPGRER